MNRARVLVDTGPLVAVFSDNDLHHETCLAELGRLHPPLFTCWPVVTEAAWLLRRDPGALEALFGAFQAKLLCLLPLDESAFPWFTPFLRRYAKLKPQLADTALVYLAEREGIRRVFTLDRADFSVYRVAKNQAFELIPEL